MNFLKKIELNRFFIFALGVGVVVYLIFFMMDYSHWFIHPHSSEDQLNLLVPDSLHFRWHDWVQPFVKIADKHDRARFLSYFITLIDYRLRFLGYDYFVLFPPFSASWILTLGIAPYLLFRSVRNLGMSVESAVITLILYIASTGFLSCYTMVMLAAKPVSNAMFVVCLYLMSRLKIKAKQGELFCEIKSPLKIALLLAILLSLFLDELPLFLFVFLPVVFLDLFLVPGTPFKNVGRMAKNIFYFLAPFWMFLFLITSVVPLITQHYFNYRFDYLGTVFSAEGEQTVLGKFLAVGESARFILHSFADNLLSLLGTSFVPWQLCPFITHETAGQILSGQSHNAAQFFILTSVFAGAGVLMFQTEREKKNYFSRFVLVGFLYAMFMSIIIGRTIVYITGYYYGSTFALFLACAAGFCFEEACGLGNKTRWLATGLAVLMLVIQLNNFSVINNSCVTFHNEVWTRNIYKNTFPMADNKPLTREELRVLRQEWKKKTIVDYLKDHSVSTGAVFLLAELRHRDTRYHDL